MRETHPSPPLAHPARATISNYQPPLEELSMPSTPERCGPGSAVGTTLDALNRRKAWPAGPAVGTTLDALIMASGFCLFLGFIRCMFFIVMCCDDVYYSIAC